MRTTFKKKSVWYVVRYPGYVDRQLALFFFLLCFFVENTYIGIENHEVKDKMTPFPVSWFNEVSGLEKEFTLGKSQQI